MIISSLLGACIIAAVFRVIKNKKEKRERK